MSFHQKWLEQVATFKNQLGPNLQLPPPSLEELKMEYLEMIPNTKLVAKLPFQKRFTNPVKLYQGGFLSAGIDEVFGPLSYTTAGRPCMTLSMNLTYLKAFTEEMNYCVIEATVLQKTKSFIFMRAEVKSPSNELMAHAESHVAILRDDQLEKVKA